ncbi:MAG TPA: metallophosphatase, partial [Balneolaceae bacterium]|nr:metallophosphatase [Balneolaceae bacterium]
QPNTLLLDAGDVFQGTTWFNVHGGSVDFELMSDMKYDAGVIGNHEFDNGPDGFAQAAKKASFPFLNANYAVRKTPFDSYVQKFMVKELAGFRIGIFGLGIRLDGVVDKKLTGDVQYRDPEIWANGMVSSLRKTHRCDYIICLSHLGYHYDDSRIDDKKLAARVKGIDLIIGGHTHTFLDHPVLVQTPEGGQTAITQAGHSGIRLGRVDLSVKNEKLFISDSIQYTINGN